MKIYAKKWMSRALTKFGSKFALFKYHSSIRLAKVKAYLKKNWAGVVLDGAIALTCAFAGLLFGGFLGFLFVINALLGF